MTRLATNAHSHGGGALIFALMAVVAGPALAASPPAADQAPAVQAVLDCRKIVDGAQRLACFDSAASAMARAGTAGDLVSLDRAQRRAARHQAFGLTLPSLAFLDRGEKPEEINAIQAKVATASRDPAGKWVIRLDDGAVWRQIDDNDIYPRPRAGSLAHIRRASLGSFFMNFGGRDAIRVHRDN
ncbi:MAG: hypothetical protein ACR2F8_02395 [Caulobacteraceae bacterium]